MITTTMEEDLSYPFVSDGSLQSVKFGVATSDEVQKYCVSGCPISHPSQLTTNSFLGLPLESGKCESCGTAEHGKCEGHFGYIELPVPVFHPSHVSELKHLLNLVCLNCMRMKKGKVKQKNGGEAVSSVTCSYCRDLPPITVKQSSKADGALYLELTVPSKTMLHEGFWDFLMKFGFRYGGDTSCRILLPKEALSILEKIPKETEKRLASKGYFLQKGFIMQCLPVPPNCLTIPEISDGTSRMSADISTSMLKRVLNKIECIKKSRSGAPSFIAHHAESVDLQSSIIQYLLLRGTPKVPQDISRKYGVGPDASAGSAKKWLDKMKTLFISKGSGFCSRCIITGDSYMGINEIGLPSEIARRMTFEERVTAHNINRLQKMVDDGLCVMYKDGPATYAIAVGCKGHTFLKVGQLIHRQIVDGDIVFINRPPSTHKHSMQAFSVFLHDEHTVKMNPLICPCFGADFDGDCVHIFYPQSLAAKAEVVELFSVEKQLRSSHDGKVHLQFLHDSLLALKLMCNTFLLNKPTAQQFAFFVSPLLQEPDSGSLWSVLQIFRSALPEFCKSFGEKHMLDGNESLNLKLDRDALPASLTEIITSIFETKGPKMALDFFNKVQPLLMEILFSEGYSITLKDFSIPRYELESFRNRVQELSLILRQQSSTFTDVVQSQFENMLRDTKRPIETFILGSAMGNLIDSKSDSSLRKVVQQIGFLGRELYVKGKLYSMYLVDEIYSHIVKCYSPSDDHPSEAYGLIKSSFIYGLNPYEMLVHSLSSREVMVRSSRGLTEPGVLFKNLMATLRDVVVCYDGTVRNVCSDFVVQFEYGAHDVESSLPGEPVGILAATAISTPAYKAVLDSTQSTNSSWELMKEVLLCKVNYKGGSIDRRVILYLNDCFCGRKFCKENAAVAVQDCLKSVTLKDCTTDFLIKYEKQSSPRDDSETTFGLVGHIHLNKLRLKELKRSTDDMVQICEGVILKYGKKKSNLSHYFKKIYLSSSACSSQCACLQFSYFDVTEPLERSIDVMSNVVCPVLLDTIVKGDPRVVHANIVWIGPDATSWVRNANRTLKGELAVEVLIKKEDARRSGDAWCISLDACLPVIHLIDTRRSIPYGIMQIQELLGISCALDQSVQRLSASIKMVAKGVIKEHLILVGNCMTCTGKLIGFTSSGFRALFRSLKVEVPFTESTLYTPMKCFERAAEKYQCDSLSSVVSSCSWGKHVAVGTGTRFHVMWDKNQMATEYKNEKDVYDFLELVKTTSIRREAANVCLGVDVDDLYEDDENNETGLSPKLDADFEFDDNAEGEWNSKTNATSENWEGGNSSWEKASNLEIGSEKSNGWGSAKQPVSENARDSESHLSSWEKVSAPNVTSDKWHGWESGKQPASDITEPHLSSRWGGEKLQQQPSESATDGKEVNGFHSWDKLEVNKNPSASEHADHENWRPNKRDFPEDKVNQDHPRKSTIWNKNVTSSPEDQPCQNPSYSKPGSWGSRAPKQGKSTFENDEVQDGWRQDKKVPAKHAWGIPRSENSNIESSSNVDKNNEAQESWRQERELPTKHGWGIPSSENAIVESSNVDKNTDAQGWRKDKELPTKHGWGIPSSENANVESSNADKSTDAQEGWGKEKELPTKHGWGIPSSENANVESSNADKSTDAQEGWGKEKELPTKHGWGIPSSENANVESSNADKRIDAQEGWGKEKELPTKHGWGTPSSANANVENSTKVDRWNSDNEQNKAESEPWGTQPESSGVDRWNASKVSTRESPWGSQSGDADRWNANKAINHGSQGESTSKVNRWNANKVSNHGGQARGSQGWGFSQNANGRNQRPYPSRAGSTEDRTGNPKRNFSPEEEIIRAKVQPLMDSSRRILHSSSNGEKLSAEDEHFIVENVFNYHPAKEAKVTGKVDYIMVDENQDHRGTRCFFVVSGDGARREDFSYPKCIQNFVKQSFPVEAESFIGKFFAKRSSGPPRENSQQQ